MLKTFIFNIYFSKHGNCRIALKFDGGEVSDAKMQKSKLK